MSSRQRADITALVALLVLFVGGQVFPSWAVAWAAAGLAGVLAWRITAPRNTDDGRG